MARAMAADRSALAVVATDSETGRSETVVVLRPGHAMNDLGPVAFLACWRRAASFPEKFSAVLEPQTSVDSERAVVERVCVNRRHLPPPLKLLRESLIGLVALLSIPGFAPSNLISAPYRPAARLNPCQVLIELRSEVPIQVSENGVAAVSCGSGLCCRGSTAILDATLSCASSPPSQRLSAPAVCALVASLVLPIDADVNW
jgi:hypothetical protein